MQKIIHKADTRGSANHGWLISKHTFSFAEYYDPTRVQFGALRVLNDDIIAGGSGFGEHAHHDMEIISIPILGALEHKDSLGNTYVINKNDVQIMSAGSGVRHSEYNHSANEEANFLQIWILPKQKNIKPRYDQKSFLPEDRKNKWQLVVSANPADKEALWINQNAYFSLANVEKDTTLPYILKNPSQAVYIFVIEGKIEMEDEILDKRDAMGLINLSKTSLKAHANSQVLLMEIPIDNV